MRRLFEHVESIASPGEAPYACEFFPLKSGNQYWFYSNRWGPFFIRAPTFAPLLISFATLLHASFCLTSPREEASSDKSKLVAQLPPSAETDFGFSPHEEDLTLNPFSALPFHAIWHQSVDLEEDLFFLLPTLLFPFYFIPSRGFLVAEACKTSGMLLAIS